MECAARLLPLINHAHLTRTGGEDEVFVGEAGGLGGDAEGGGAFEEEGAVFGLDLPGGDAEPGVGGRGAVEFQGAGEGGFAAGFVAIAAGGVALLDVEAGPGVAEGGGAPGVEGVALPGEAFLPETGVFPNRPLAGGIGGGVEGGCDLAGGLDDVVAERGLVSAASAGPRP